MLTRTIVIGAAAAAVLAGASIPAATAATGVKAGTLVCDVEGGIGLIIASDKGMTCTYSPVKGSKERYTGSIRKFGIDIGVTGKARMIWVVFAPGKVHAGALRGSYVGAVAEAAVGAGGGAKVLVGGHGKSITLQPLSVQGHTGVNVAAGVGVLELK